MEPTEDPISSANRNAVHGQTQSYPAGNAQNQIVDLTPQNSQYFNNSIFWIEVEKIVPNPYQPRREFDPHALKDLSESIRMYGLLQPLVVTRREVYKEDGGLAVQYELISGERRLRASKLAGLIQVPVIIRASEEDPRVKLELAIIENLQREDLNPVDRARSFQRLADEFGLKHSQIAEKMGKSREYVTNSIRLLALPEHMIIALSEKRITEGHTRPLLMLADKPEEQETLFKEIIYKKMTVREAEAIARRVAVERTRKKDTSASDPEIREYESKLNQALGTRVMIERREKGGKVVIDFFSNDDLRHLLDVFESRNNANGNADADGKAFSTLFTVPDMTVKLGSENPVETPQGMQIHDAISDVMNRDSDSVLVANPAIEHVNERVEHVANIHEHAGINNQDYYQQAQSQLQDFAENTAEYIDAVDTANTSGAEDVTPIDDSTPTDTKEDEDLYSIKNFSV